MEPKDIASIVLSTLAFALSATAFVVSYRRGQNDQRRAIREQLTDTTDKIAENQLEYVKLMFGDAKGNLPMQQAIDSILGQRTLSLLNQAVYLTTLKLAIPTAVDFNTIAMVSGSAGDLAMADTHYRKAIDAATNDSFRSNAIRSYAMFLFGQRRFEEGRQAFRDAAMLIKGGDNLARVQKGFIYQTWGWCEMNNANAPNQAAAAFENARGEFTGIDNEAIRQTVLARLEMAKGSPVPPTPQVLQRAEAPNRVWS